MATILLPKVNQKSLSSKDERESRDVKTEDFRRTVDDLQKNIRSLTAIKGRYIKQVQHNMCNK